MSLSEVVGTTNDIFLSYSSADRDVVRNVARRLREAGVKVWFDKDSLSPGSGWQDELATQLMDSRACAVFVGPDEIVGWKRYEMEVALDRSVRDRDFQVFPVLLPGIEHFDASVLPPFLATRQWVDLRAGPESAEAIQDLINAMRGVARQIPAVVDGGPECPYRGLEVFEEEHAPYFFGRGAQAQRLVESLRQGRFVAVIGQSGVGKSSLVRAGLLPRIRAGALPGSKRWRVLLIRPGPLPMTTLSAKILALNPQARTALDKHGTGERMLNEAVVVALADEAAGSKLVVFVDQFEEAFALCQDPAERRAFLENLHYAATFPHGPVVVVVTLRADFYPRLAEFPAFAQLAQSHQVLVPQLGNQELRDVILEPAYKVGLTVEQGLADTILGDVVRDPGTLPLLEHALLETWGHRRGAMLTLEGYRATGGVQHALGERAETVYAGLSDTAKEQAGYVFLRLIQPGEGTEDTRRRVSVNEITTGDDAAAEVIRQFVDAWLLTTNADEATGARWVEISHEAVITGWARCARWVDEDRAGLIVHRRLTQAAEEWERQGRSADALYRGVPLAEALAWRDLVPDRLNRWEVEFLDAARDLARAQRRSRRRRLAATFAALITALVVIAVVAVMAVARAHIATSRQLAAEANDTLDTDPALSVTLALRALDTASTSQAEAVLRQATAESRGRSMVRNPGGTVYSVRLLPDGRRAVSGSRDGAVRLWDLATGALQQTYPLHTGQVFAAVSPDGMTAASGGIDRAVVLTQLATGQSRTLWTAAAPTREMEFSHDGRLLALALDDGTAPVIDVATGQTVRVLRPGGGRVWGVVYSSGADGTVRVWDVHTDELLMTFPDTDGVVSFVDVSPDGTILKSAETQKALRLLSCEVCGPLDSVVDFARSHAFRTLTPDEEKRFAPAS